MSARWSLAWPTQVSLASSHEYEPQIWIPEIERLRHIKKWFHMLRFDLRELRNTEDYW